MSSKYGFESPEQKRRRLEQEASERAREERVYAAQQAADYEQTEAQVHDIIADFVKVKGLEVSEWNSMSVYHGVWPILSVKVDIYTTEIVVKEGEYADYGDAIEFAKVLREQTGKKVTVWPKDPPRRGNSPV